MICFQKKTDARRGMTLLEATVALFIVSAVVLAILQLVSVTGNQRRSLEVRRMALQEVANEAERIAVMPWEQSSPDELNHWEPAEDLLAVSPRAKCSVTVSEEPGSPLARRIRLSIAQTSAASEPIELAALTVWKFAPGNAP